MAAAMEWTLEVVVVPVSDVDRAISSSSAPVGNGWAVQQISARGVPRGQGRGETDALSASLHRGPRPLEVDESPSNVENVLGSGRRLGSTKPVVRLQHAGRLIYVNPANVTFFAEGEPRGGAPTGSLAEGAGVRLALEPTEDLSALIIFAR